MRIAWLVVVATVCGLSGSAHAKRMACSPPLTGVDVARLQHVDEDDRTPPATPVVRHASIERSDVMVLADYAPDTVLVELTIIDSAGTTTKLYTEPGRPYLCTQNVYSSGTATISVAALDRAGNASSTVASAEVSLRVRYRCGTGFAALFVLIPFLLAIVAVVIMVWLALRRRALRLPGEPVPPLVAESAVRIVLHRSVIAFVIGTAAVLVLRALDHEGYALLTTLVPLTAITRVIASHLLLRALDRPDARAELHDTLLAVGSRYVVASSRVMRRARAQAIPRART